ncbi:MAG: universal stress protein [Oligoflexales bacterium]
MKIIVACDGSQQSTKAIELLKQLPIQDARFQLINVAPVIEYDPEVIAKEAKEKIEAYNTDMLKKANELLNDAKKLVEPSAQSCEAKLVEGSPAEVLIEQSKDADLIVMGSRGLNPIKKIFLGSVSDALLRHAECSVLLYKEPKKGEASADPLKVVVGYDDTPNSREACEFLKKFAPNQMSSADLLAVMQTHFYYGMNYSSTILETWPRQKQVLEESLEAMKRELENQKACKKVGVTLKLDSYDVAHEINDFAKEANAGLILVGSKGKNLIDRVFIGSVSNKLAHHGELPLLVVR